MEQPSMQPLMESFDGLLDELTRNGHPEYSHQDQFIRVRVNRGALEVRVFKGWLEGSGPAAWTALSMMILGTEEGIQGSRELQIDDAKLLSQIIVVLAWLAAGDEILLQLNCISKSRDLYALATYFGLEKLQATIKRYGWDTGDSVVSTDNVGVVFKLVHLKKFEFILDKTMRKETWFRLSSVKQTDSAEEGPKVQVGTECCYDIKVSQKRKETRFSQGCQH